MLGSDQTDVGQEYMPVDDVISALGGRRDKEKPGRAGFL